MSRELISAIEQISREKGIDQGKIVAAVETAIETAARKRYPNDGNIQATLDTRSGEVEIVSFKAVVEEDDMEDPTTEISLERALEADPDAEIGDEVGFLLEMAGFGRIAAQAAKQVIFQQVREAEWEAIYGEYTGREGQLVTGMILGQERRNYIVELGRTEALLPASEQIPREVYRRGDRIRALLLEVRETPRGPQLILSRNSPLFVQKLFEMEVPEIAEGIVTIQAIARDAGDRTKMAVWSRERGVDPVGACVGMKGSRVQAVVRELHGEKIDIISWTDDPQRFIAEALSPAEIDRVGITEDEHSAIVIVRDDQLSLAIGKKGQNVRLASRLTGWNLDILSESEYREDAFEGKDEELEAALLDHARAKAQGLTDAEALFSNFPDAPAEGAAEEAARKAKADSAPEAAEAGASAPGNAAKQPADDEPKRASE
ncbi:MAG: transcription termination/antitermination protein NusA [Nitrospirae bacterium]|nr:transcription termination/antitermination protein NusA [Nitrospirota bacterium]